MNFAPNVRKLHFFFFKKTGNREFSEVRRVYGHSGFLVSRGCPRTRDISETRNISETRGISNILWIIFGVLCLGAVFITGCSGSGSDDNGKNEHDASVDARVEDASPQDQEDSGTNGNDECETSGEGDFSVTKVIGDVGEGSAVVICGYQFGDLGPTYVLFDNMESGQNGEQSQLSDPIVGEWWRAGKEYSDEAGRSGSMSMVIGGGEGATVQFGIPDENAELELMHFTEIFVSWALRDMGVFPGNNSSETEFSTDSSAKDLWLMYGNRGDNYDYSCSQGTCNGNDVVLVTHTGSGSFKIDGNNTNSSWWLGGFWQFQTWNPMSTYLKINPEDPYGPIVGAFEHISPEGGYIRDDYEGTMMREEHDQIPPVWDRIKFGSWYRSTEGFRRLIDDIYIALGDGAAARVEIADAPQIEEVTRLAISTIDEWSENRLEATIRLGDLDPEADDLYLFVVNADNERSPGFALNNL